MNLGLWFWIMVIALFLIFAFGVMSWSNEIDKYDNELDKRKAIMNKHSRKLRE